MFLFGALLMSCDSDDDVIDDEFQGETKEYSVQSVAGSSVEGTVLFTENEDGSTTIDLSLEGTEDGGSYLAAINSNTASEGGETIVSLEPVDAPTGASTTTVSELDDETGIGFQELANFDGHLSIYVQGEADAVQVLAVADLGENQLTGEETTFELAALTDHEINGTARFEQRENDETLVSIQLDGTDAEGTYPVQIIVGPVDGTGDEVAVILNPVDGASGSSQSNVAQLYEDTQEAAAITYEELVNFDGHLNVYLSQDDMETILSQGNIAADSDTEGTE